MSLDKVIRGISVGAIAAGAALTGGAALVDRASAKYQAAPLESALTTEWEKSSLTFVGSCSGDCYNISAKVCNTGDGDMTGSVPWELFYAVSGNPKDGSVIDNGSLGPLDKDECETLSYNPNNVSGNYMWRVEQEAGHPGSGELWSEACNIYCPVDTPTTVPTPTDTVEPTPTDTAVPTPTDTAVPTPTDTAVPTPTGTYVSPTPTNTEAPTPTYTSIPPTATPKQVETITPAPPSGGAMAIPMPYSTADLMMYAGLGLMAAGTVGFGASYLKRR